MDKDQQAEADYMKEIADMGLDVPGLKTPTEESEDDKEESQEESEKENDSEKSEDDKSEDDSKELTDQPEVPRKRSIYKDYKDLKKEKKTLEEEVSELRSKLEAIEESNNSEEKEIATNDAIEYAKQVNADPKLVELIIQNAAERNKVEIDPELRKRLDDFDKFQRENAAVIEKQMFEQEFMATVPTIKEFFPNASAEELAAMKTELDTLSHSKEMHDKPLDYIVFKNREHLQAFVSPKKRGMEEKGRNQQEEGKSSEIDFSNVDLTTMTLAQREEFEKRYEGAVKAEKDAPSKGKIRKLN